jgi:hypothetical protein
MGSMVAQKLSQRPAVHGIPSQQSAIVVQSCPYRAHMPPELLPEEPPLDEPPPLDDPAPLDEPPPLEDPPVEPPLDELLPEEPPLDEPPSLEDPPEDPPLDDPPGPPSAPGLQGPQMPAISPWPMTHDSPAQQSALTVQAPQAETHPPPPG